MKIRILTIIPVFIFLSNFGFAQEAELENLLESQEEYSDISDLVQILSDLEENPININSAKAEQLSVLPWLSDVQSVAIVKHRQNHGKFNSIDDLLNVESVSSSTAEAIEKYISFEPTVSLSDFRFRFKSRFNRKMEQSQGLQDGSYYPSPFKYYNRFSARYNNSISLGGVLEKDPGEKQFNDLGLFYLKFENPSSGDRLILGSYRLEFGHGLVFWNPYGYNSSGSPLFAAKKNAQGLKEYTLVDENASLYGIAGKKCLKIYQFFIFYSEQKLDATLNPDGSVKNFYQTGYHRNDLELQKRKTVTEKLIGGRAQLLPLQNVKLGLTFYKSRYDRQISLNDMYRSRFAFNGKENHVLGSDFNLNLGTLNFFGEYARSKNNGYGFLTGLLFHAGTFEFITLARHYSKNFISMHGRGYSAQGDQPQNEQGVLMGVHFNALKNLKLSFAYDRYKFPWRTYFIPMPSHGHELLFRATHKPLKGLWLHVQARLRQKDQVLYTSDILGREVTIIYPRSQLNLRFQIDYNPYTFIKLRQRLERVRVNYQENENTLFTDSAGFNGMLVYQDLTFNISKALSISTRLSFFDTDNYDSRLYQFERDVPGMLTNYMLYGKGSRVYGFVQYKVKKFLRLSLKISSTQYLHKKSIGTGSDKIEGNTLNSINFQIESNW